MLEYAARKVTGRERPEASAVELAITLEEAVLHRRAARQHKEAGVKRRDRAIYACYCTSALLKLIASEKQNGHLAAGSSRMNLWMRARFA